MRLKIVMCWLLGLLLVAAGLNHFRMPGFYVRIMPPYLPWHLELVYISGIAEVLLGLLLLCPRYRVAAAWGTIALLAAVFPANLHMALNADQFPEFRQEMLWLRLPLQGVLITWAYWFTRRPGTAPAARP